MAKQDKTKKAYKKPKVTQVKLEIEESVLAGCKVDDLDPNGKTNKRACGVSPCDYAAPS